MEEILHAMEYLFYIVVMGAMIVLAIGLVTAALVGLYKIFKN